MEFNQQFYYFRGRVALAEILKAADVKQGDLVAIQGFTCTAVLESLLAVGVKPVFIDIDRNTLSMSIISLKEKAQSNKLKAVVIQHTFGINANIKNINSFAKSNGIFSIEDSCHRIEPTYTESGELLCDACFFSYEWGKPMPAGLGGSAIIKNLQHKEVLQKNFQNFSSPSIFTEINILSQKIIFKYLYSPKTFWILKIISEKLNFIRKSNYNNLDYVSNEFNTSFSKVSKFFLEREFKNNILAEIKELNIESLSKIIPTNFFAETIANNKEKLHRYPIFLVNKGLVVKKSAKCNIELSSWYNTPVHPLNERELLRYGYEKEELPNAEWACKHVVNISLSKNFSSDYLKRLSLFLEENT